MAYGLTEMGKIRYRDEYGRFMSGSGIGGGSYGCSGWGMGAEKLVPFDIPGLEEEPELNLTDAILGAVGGKILVETVDGVVGQRFPQYANMFKLGISALTIGGFFVDRLRNNSLFLGFALQNLPAAVEPLTEWITGMVSRVTGKVSGSIGIPYGTYGRRLGYNGYRRPTSRVAGRRLQAITMAGGRVGQPQKATQVMPTILRPSDMIAAGQRGMAGVMNGGGNFNKAMFSQF
jgi:hypothetical protein